MRYSLLVTAGPDSPAAATALHMAEALLQRGHPLFRVFFYRQGVLLASRLPVVSDGEQDLCAEWRALVAQHQLDAVVCIGAALRRGILDADESRRHHRDADNLAPGFTLGGLGLWAEAVAESDRVLSFGA
ncbi:sulfurtransferase complex subunit TusD [Isoalcanivorax indicus]|uniref:sulfurtransferase complex subunit TusD n=1 Tax=Isoalcanivorax indicus TaxID=2202653 RepID=UPI000DBA31AF|nr:sulfurtransferase complex subunit TusD [Isoalcanivorax indicus]